MQAVVDGIIAACAFLPVALGFFVFYRVSGILHFAHGAIIPLSGYAFLNLSDSLGVPLTAAIPLSLLLAVLAGVLIELSFYRPLREWDRGRLGTFVVSFGLYILMASLLSLVFGDETRLSGIFPANEGMAILGARISVIRMLIGLNAVGTMLATWLFLHRTNQGRYLRAIASNNFLARAVGLPMERTYLAAIGFGSLMAATTGILMTMDTGIEPNAGLSPLLLGVIAVFVGGRSEFGVVVGAFVIGLAQHVATIWIPSKWQDTIAFVLLSLVLLVRPGGLVGKHAPEVES